MSRPRPAGPAGTPVSGWPVLRAASGGLSRRLVPTLVAFTVLAAATAAAIFGVTLLTNANEAAVNARAAYHSADISVTVNEARATAAQLAATRSVHGVTGVTGPYPQATVTLRYAARSTPGGGPKGGPGGSMVDLRTIIGRASPGGPLDDLSVGPGHWPSGPGQIVLPPYEGAPPVGSAVTVVSAPGKPRLTVVGYGGSQGRFGDGWVLPGELAALRSPRSPARAQMLYTFTRAANIRQVTADVAALRAALPAGTVVSYDSWLDAIGQTSGESAFNTPFVLVFALLGLVLAALIVANLVSAAVVAGYRRIGVLKSIGFTPLQVAGAYVAQACVPAVAGITAGALAGNWWATPLLSGPADLLGVGAQHVPGWIDVAAPAGMCLLVVLAAAIPAWRAGRLPAVQVIAAGQAPRTGRGYAAHRIAARLALPRPVTIGLAAPFARLARGTATFAAILFGATAVITAAGLSTSVAKIFHYYPAAGLGQVAAGVPKGSRQLSLTASQCRQITAAARARPATRHVVADYDNIPGSVTVTGMTALNLEAYGGDSAWLGWPLIAGTWYRGHGQVDANTEFLTEMGLRVGDRLTINVGPRRVVTRIAGQVYDPNGPSVWTARQTLGAVAGLGVTDYRIGLRPGTSPQRYAAALGQQLGPEVGVHLASQGTGASSTQPTNLIRELTELIAALAALGVLSSVLMATRERVHDLGVFKSVGMTPRQTLVMVICGVIAPAAAAAAIAVPAAIYLHAVTVREIGTLTGSGMATGAVAVYRPAELLLLALSGLVIAAVGALLPASWAAAARTTTALRAE